MADVPDEIKKAQTRTKDAKIDKIKKSQLEIMHVKTHQEMINVAYKAADNLGIAPWVLIRAAGWGNFSQDRGALYDGEHIMDINALSDEQKEALMGALGMKSGYEKIKSVK